ncbi:ElaB/YqjD/DUF883 family membrane-anchored ribosome-binding protein [Microvirga lupini]|uniref:ElaB/YqjD/DUF883 family membrane-anchored ribosome-binding protein n=1 Tax=Microvirga lupini TaxID=420324 RepID=A0A7W4VIA6_9HYPH|nr:hypothetical protein [Microvirga lupini]MBB3017748.1 ElaB/YqjD/DUF883 family membrane-anchored ribosome-binding protein [Microvirga lupini]
MANTKNETGKPGADKQNDTGAASKVSAGTSVGNIGEAPMPHAHDPKSAQGAGSTTSNAQSGGQSRGSSSGQSSGQSSQRNAQDQAGMTDKAQQAADQVRQKAEEAFEGASDWARDTYERASDWASDTYSQQRRRMNRMGGRSSRAFGNARGGVQSYVSENPMVVGLVGLAAGLLLGALLPRTRRENEMFGEWADEVRNQGLRYARDAASRGREYVEENFSGDDAQFSRHESEFGGQRDANRH